MTDVIVLSLERWDTVWRRNQHLIAGLLRRDPQLRVLFVEPAPDPLHALLHRSKPELGHGPRALAVDGAEGRLWTFRPTKALPRKIDPQVDRRLADATIKAARKLGFVDPVLWVNDPGGAEVVRQTAWPALYDITDDWLEADRPEAEHERLVRDEGDLMREAAEVVVCSPTLVASKSKVRPVTLIPNAVDVDDYRRSRPRPADLPDGGTAVYVGTIHRDRIDVDLCVQTADALGDRGHVVLVGPNLLDEADQTRLRSAGVVLLGAKDKGDVPGYLQHADVLVVPHVVTPFTMSLDPIKRYEYATVGRPVVSTPVTGFVDVEDPRVRAVETDEFARAVADAIPAPYLFPEQLDDVVPRWSDRVAQMAQVIARASARPRGHRPMKLVIDVLSAPSTSGGMRAYAEEVVGSWHEAMGAQEDELIVHGEPWIEESFGALDRVTCVPVVNPNKVKRLTLQWGKTAALYRRHQADAVLSLGPVVTGLVPARRRFCVVHDWRHIKNPAEFSRATLAYRKLWLASVRGAAKVFVISEKTSRGTLEQVASARVVVVPNGTDHPRRWGECAERAPSGEDVVTFGHHPNKRPDLVLRAFARVPETVRGSSSLMILGARGEWRDALRSLARDLGIEDRVKLPGFVADTEYRRAIQRARAVVLASTDEGFGLPVVEARYFGIPVVATRDSGLGEIHESLPVCDPTPQTLAGELERALISGRGEPQRGWSWVDVAASMRGHIAVELGLCRGT